MFRSQRKPASTARRLRGESGQSLVELAFAIPLVLLVILALVDFGLAINTELDATQAANEGARLAAVNGTNLPCATLAKNIKNDAFGGGLTNATVMIRLPNGGSGNIGDPIRVDVTTDFKYTTGGLIPLPPLKIHGTATMRLEQKSTFASPCP
jgi:Flp pilus assembly protein TadG